MNAIHAIILGSLVWCWLSVQVVGDVVWKLYPTNVYIGATYTLAWTGVSDSINVFVASTTNERFIDTLYVGYQQEISWQASDNLTVQEIYTFNAEDDQQSNLSSTDPFTVLGYAQATTSDILGPPVATSSAASSSSTILGAPVAETTSSPSTTPTQTSSTPAETTTTATPSPHLHSATLSAGAIAGIILGAIAVTALCAIAFFLWWRHRARYQAVTSTQQPVSEVSMLNHSHSPTLQELPSRPISYELSTSSESPELRNGWSPQL